MSHARVIFCRTFIQQYVFVFLWTPALRALMVSEGEDNNAAEENQEHKPLPLGVIFSTFMVCCMAGSSLFSILIQQAKAQVIAVGVLCLASVAMLIIATTQNGSMAFFAMNLFELSVGMYFPVMGTIKGSIVPEDKRAAVYNLYRIPLNAIVLCNLLTNLSSKTSFQISSGMLILATVLQYNLMKRRSLHDEQEEGAGGMKQEQGEQETVPLTTKSDANV